MPLKPAQNYEEELRQKLRECWYTSEHQYFFGGDLSTINLQNDAFWRHDFVYIDKYGDVAGYFSYNYNDGDKSIRNFGLISFTPNWTGLLRDALERLRTLFDEGAQRAEFFCFADNPAKAWYDRIVSRFGGHEVGHLHRTAYFHGCYHDAIIYEVLAENYHAARERIDTNRSTLRMQRDEAIQRYIDTVGKAIKARMWHLRFRNCEYIFDVHLEDEIINIDVIVKIKDTDNSLLEEDGAIHRRVHSSWLPVTSEAIDYQVNMIADDIFAEMLKEDLCF